MNSPDGNHEMLETYCMEQIK